VALGRTGTVGQEVPTGGELSAEIWMTGLDLAVDHRDRRATPGGKPVEVGKAPFGGGRLDREKRVVG
jgi:hypothetical protein